MIYPKTFESKIGFDRIRQMISQECLCQLGRNYVDKIHMFTEEQQIDHELVLVHELKRILLFEENFPQDNYIDITPSLKKIDQVNSFMDTTELLQFRKSIATIKSLERYFSDSENKEKSPALCKEFKELSYFPVVGNLIDTILTKEGSIKDRLDDELSNHLRFSIYKITFGFSVISLAAMALFLSLREIQTINTMAILYTLEAVLLLHITLYHLGRKYSPKWLLRKDDVSAEYNKSFRILFIIIGILVFMLIYLLPWMGLIKK